MTAAQRHPGRTQPNVHYAYGCGQPIQADCNRKQALALSVLYYKTAIRGRATLILALKPVLDPSSGANLADKAMVLKLIWRDQARFREGLILGQFSGVHGLCQKLFEGDVLIGGSPDVVYPRQDLSPGPLGDVFGSGTDKVDVQGAIQDSAHVQGQLLMQPGRPLKEALNEFELVAGMIGALMGMQCGLSAWLQQLTLSHYLVDTGHWALVRNQVQHRDISINNIILPDGHEYTHDSKALEWERLREYGAGRCAHEFVMPDWVGLFNEPNEPKYKSVEKLEWNFDPKRRLLVLEKVIRDLGRSEPFGFLSDLDMANILSLSRSDVHMDRTGTSSFMAIKLLRATFQEPIRHTFIHDLESFYWVVLYVISDHRDQGAPQLNPAAIRVRDQLYTIDYLSLGNAKYAMLGDIANKELHVGTFGTTWARSLAPMVQKFAKCIDRIRISDFDSTACPDACFEEVLSIFLDAIPEIRPDTIPKSYDAEYCTGNMMRGCAQVLVLHTCLPASCGFITFNVD